MSGLFQLKRSLPGRYVVVFILAVALGFLGPAAVAHTFCPPQCGMHEPAPGPPSCGENPWQEHDGTQAAGDGDRSAPAPEPCCGVKFCIDSSASAPELTGAPSVVISDIHAPARMSDHTHLVRFASPVKLPSGLARKAPPVAVYIRTCVFLI